MAHSEVLMVSAIVQSGDMGPAMHAGITEQMLKVCPNEYGWITSQNETLGHVPDQTAFHAQFPSFKLIRTEDVAAHVHAVVQAHARDRLLKLTDGLMDMLADGEIDRAITTMGSELVSIQATFTEVNDSTDVIDEWEELADMVEAKAEKVKRLGMAGVPTGWRSLDAVTGGLQEGWLVIVGGRLGTGKTWVMVRMAVEAVLEGRTALYYSLEQSRYQIGLRAQSALSRAVGTEHQLRSLDMMKGTAGDVRGAMKEIATEVGGKFLVNDTSRGQVGTMQVAAAIERHQPDIVFIDYITLLAMTGDGDWHSVARLSADLKRLAERYEIPIVAGSQLNRTAVGDNEPDAGSLAQGDSIGHDADLIVLISKEKNQTVTRRMKLEKNRHGPDGIRWHVRFKPGNGDITEISGDEAERLKQAEREKD